MNIDDFYLLSLEIRMEHRGVGDVGICSLIF